MAGKSPPDGLPGALDELRFGAEGILNLRVLRPTVSDAERRAERWLRERQIRGAKEALIVTGRGNQSEGGVSPVRAAVERLLYSLRRRGVILGHGEHNPGAFVVRLAPMRALVDAPPRRRERKTPSTITEVPGLSTETTALVRALAEASLGALGVVPTEENLPDEMQRHLRAIVPGLAGGAGMEERLRDALRSAMAEYD